MNITSEIRSKLLPLIDAGLLNQIPNRWQIRQGEYEMAPHVIIPDTDDGDRYAGAKLGHPLLRTPLTLCYIGLDHFRVGTGLGASKKSLIRHLCIVHHQIMPDWDLQLLQMFPTGLKDLRDYIMCLDKPLSCKKIKRHKRWIDKVLPNAQAYRNDFIKKGGWIDKAEKFEYTEDRKIPSYLRKEFFSLARFLDWSLRFPESVSFWKKPAILSQRFFCRWQTHLQIEK